MTTRPLLRSTAAAALAACAGFGAQAMEATQWNPQADAAAVASVDATLSPMAWSVDRGEATEFRDGQARDSITARAAVRTALQRARSKGLLNDTGEGGATERVLAQRDAFNESEHERLLAVNTPAPEGDDVIAQLAAASFEHQMIGGPLYEGPLYETTPASVTIGLAADEPGMPDDALLVSSVTARPQEEPIAG